MARSLFSKHERFAIDLAVRHAEQQTRFEFSVFVGASDPDSGVAEQLHAALVAPQVSVLVAVDPVRRMTQVVTGALVVQSLPDSDVSAVLDKVRSEFTDGRLAAAVVHTVRALAEATSGNSARTPPPSSGL